MITLRIEHRTTYRYSQPVRLGPHRLMLRPRESRDLRLISSEVTVAPAAHVTWAHDVFGNAVATAMFQSARPTAWSSTASRLELCATAVADLRHRGLGDRLSLSLFGRRMDRPRRADHPAISGPGRTAARNGRGRSSAAIGPIRSRCSRTSAPAFPHGSATRAGRTKARSRRSKLWIAAGAPAGISRSCSSKRRAVSVSAQDRLRLPLQSRSEPDGIDRRRIDPRLGRSLRVRRRLDQLRSDQPQRRRRQSHSRRRRARHPAGVTGGRKFRGSGPRVSGNVGRSPGHITHQSVI